MNALGATTAATEEEAIVPVRGGMLAMGSDMKEVRYCVSEWRHRLLDPDYDATFEDWILKEYPQHTVDIRPFRAMRFPVTNRDYTAFLAATDSVVPESIATSMPHDHPVWGVTLAQAQEYARWRSGTNSRPWRLPTEAEWEWMAAGPRKLRYPYGDHFDASRANSAESNIRRSTPVHAYPDGRSWCGISDLAGNVEEWTCNRYAPYPGGRFVDDDLTRLVGPDYPILRGGSFLLGGDLTRCSRRHGPHPGEPFRITGFRLVHDEVGS